METITLPRTGFAPMRFEGEKLASAGGRDFRGKQSNRWYELALYRSTSGKWIVRIGFRTTWQGEPDYDWVHVCELPVDVQSKLLEHEVMPPRVGWPPGTRLYEQRQEALAADLQARYESAVTELLSRDEFACNPEQAQAEEYMQLDLQVVRAFVASTLRGFELSQNEACAICDANNGAMLTEYCWQGVALNVFDAGRLEGLGEKWGVDAAELAKRINEAGSAVGFALAWATASFWRDGSSTTSAESLRRAGFSLRD